MDNKVTPEMIERFLKNRCGEEEAMMVADYLKKASEQELEYYLSDEEWMKEGAGWQLPGRLRKEMWNKVNAATHAGRTRSLLVLRRLAAAACIIGVLFAGYVFITRQQSNKKNDKRNMVINKEIIIRNDTRIDMDTTLTDGTLLRLKPGARLSYSGSFSDKREVYLTGMAYFDVKHDLSHPFIVHTRSIGTVDIGTTFWIVNDSAVQTISVTLVSGKVAVRSFEKSFAMNDIELEPGQKVIVNLLTGETSISDALMAKKIHAATVKEKKEHGNTIWTNAAYTFSKTSLDKVFDKIELRYHIIIKVNEADISDCQFTGKIMYSDSLDMLLSRICDMNELTYSHNGNIYEISKK